MKPLALRSAFVISTRPSFKVVRFEQGSCATLRCSNRAKHTDREQQGAVSLYHLHASLKQRFVLKNGRTWFWNRSATALVCVPG